MLQLHADPESDQDGGGGHDTDHTPPHESEDGGCSQREKPKENTGVDGSPILFERPLSANAYSFHGSYQHQ